MDAAGEAVGLATFTEGDDGVTIHVLMRGLTPGEHGWRLHEVGDCNGTTDEPFSSAGGHVRWYSRGNLDDHGLLTGGWPELHLR